MPATQSYTMPKDGDPEAHMHVQIPQSTHGVYNDIIAKEGGRQNADANQDYHNPNRPDEVTHTYTQVDNDAVDNMASVANNQTEAAAGMSLTMMVLIGVVVLAAMYFLTRKGGSPTPPPSRGGGGGGGVQGTIGPQGASMQGGGMNAQFSR